MCVFLSCARCPSPPSYLPIVDAASIAQLDKADGCVCSAHTRATFGGRQPFVTFRSGPSDCAQMESVGPSFRRETRFFRHFPFGGGISLSCSWRRVAPAARRQRQAQRRAPSVLPRAALIYNTIMENMWNGTGTSVFD